MSFIFPVKSFGYTTNNSVADEYLELLAKEGARLRSRMDGGNPAVADDSLDDDGFEDEDDDDDEDGVFVSRESIFTEL